MPKNQQSVEEKPAATAKVDNDYYEAEMARLQVELVKQQEWIKKQGLRVVVIFEGRDAAGKGGNIKRVLEPLNPRQARVVALGTPTEREKSQWYFQRYAPHLPAAGEMVLFDRSWYNRAGVERVMDFVNDRDYAEFLHSCPEFERMLVRSGIRVLKYWFSVSDEEQERRFQARLADPTKRWKFSPMDIESRNRWQDYSKAKDAMFAATDIPEAPWWVVEAEVKKRARLNLIRHLLEQIPYEDLTPDAPVLPPRPEPTADGYVRPPRETQHIIPDVVPAKGSKKKGKSSAKGKGKSAGGGKAKSAGKVKSNAKAKSDGGKAKSNGKAKSDGKARSDGKAKSAGKAKADRTVKTASSKAASNGKSPASKKAAGTKKAATARKASTAKKTAPTKTTTTARKAAAAKKAGTAKKTASARRS